MNKEDNKNCISLSSFECPCGCGKNNISDIIVINLFYLRERIGKNITVTSGCRCEKHNNDVGGSKTSSHLTGKAVDIIVENSSERFSLLECNFFPKTLFCRIGIGKNYLHLDIDEGKAQDVFWLSSS